MQGFSIKKIKYIVLVVCAMAHHSCLFAQLQLPNKYFQSTVYDRTKGLQVDEDIECISTDDKGFLWISTRNGLFRFSGILFKDFPVKKKVPGTLPSYNIRFFVQDKKGNYWLNPLKMGIWNYNDSLGTFSPFHLKNDSVNIFHYELSAPFFDEENNMWINLQGKGLMKINTSDSSCSFFDLKDSVNGYDFRSISWVTNIARYKKDLLWLTTNNGLILLNEKTGAIKKIDNLLQDDRFEKTLTGLYIDKDSSLWMGSWGLGLKHYIPAKNKWENYFINPSKKNNTENITADVYSLNDSEMLVGSNYGLLLFNKSSRLFYKCSNADAQSDYAILSEHINGGNLAGWRFCTDKSGHLFATDFFNKIITRITLSEKIFKYTQLYPGKAFNEGAFNYSYIVKEATGNYLLASSWGRGLNLYNPSERTLKNLDAKPAAPTINVNDIFQQGDSLWLSSNIGLLLYSISQNKYLAIEYNSLMEAVNGNEVTSFTSDHETAFASTYSGVVKYSIQNKTAEWLTKDNYRLPANICLRLFTDREGNVWFGMSEGTTICCYIQKTGKIKWYNDDSIVGFGNVQDITQMKDGSILYTSLGNGVYKIMNPLSPKESFSLITTTNGLASNRIFSLFTDSDGFVWFSTSNGLSVYDPVKDKMYSFYREDGLLQDEIAGRCSEISKGVIAVPLKYGFMQINRDSLLNPSNEDLPITIQKFTVNGKAFNKNIQYIHNITLPYFQNNLSIDFSARCFEDPSGIQYYYRLAGLDSNWTNIVGRTNLSLYALPPGHYILQLYAENINNHNAGKYFELAIAITPPFWKTWWFIALVIAAFIFSLYTIYHYRLKQAIRLERMRSNISSDLHDEVGATLSSISIFSETAKQLAASNPERSAAILDRIGESSRQMVDSMSDIVWSINPANDSADKILLRMRTYATELLEAKEINLEWQQQENLAKFSLGMEERKNFYLLFKEACNNIAKYSKAENVLVHIFTEADEIVLLIKDNGIGFNIKTVRKGNGLHTMQQRAASLLGKLDILSKPGEGTTIALRFPH